MFSEWGDLVSKLNDIEHRIEIIQIHQDLDEQNNPMLPRERPNRHYYQSEDDRIQPAVTNSDIQVCNFFRMNSLTMIYGLRDGFRLLLIQIRMTIMLLNLQWRLLKSVR